MIQCLQSLCLAYRAIIVGVQVFQRLHETPAHVSCLCSLDSGVHQALPARHGVEEELGGTEATVEGGSHKALALRGFVPPREVGQTAILQTASSRCRKVCVNRHGLWEALDESMASRPLEGAFAHGVINTTVCQASLQQRCSKSHIYT